MSLHKKDGSSKGRAKKRIFLVDDHAILRAGVRCMLETSGEFTICGEADNGKESLPKIAAAKPDLILIDISLPGMNGLELIKSIRAQFQDMHMLVLSMHDESLYAERALRAGARGYIMKHAPAKQLFEAIHRVLKNEIYVSPRVSHQLLHTITKKAVKTRNPLQLLSDRELEIVQLIGQGHATREIAGKLNISAKTVESHRGNIRQKLDLQNGAELIRFSLAHRENGVNKNGEGVL